MKRSRSHRVNEEIEIIVKKKKRIEESTRHRAAHVCIVEIWRVQRQHESSESILCVAEPQLHKSAFSYRKKWIVFHFRRFPAIFYRSKWCSFSVILVGIFSILCCFFFFFSYSIRFEAWHFSFETWLICLCKCIWLRNKSLKIEDSTITTTKIILAEINSTIHNIMMIIISPFTLQWENYFWKKILLIFFGAKMHCESATFFDARDERTNGRCAWALIIIMFVIQVIV